jgi:hypothetical protein
MRRRSFRTAPAGQLFRSAARVIILAQHANREGHVAHRRQVGSLGIPEGAAKDLVVWLLVLLGVVLGLGILAALEVLALLRGA